MISLFEMIVSALTIQEMSHNLVIAAKLKPDITTAVSPYLSSISGTVFLDKFKSVTL